MTDNPTSSMRKYEEKLWFFMFGYLLIDSLGTYFLWSKVGFPHNSLLVVTFLMAFLFWGVRKSVPPLYVVSGVSIIVLGFMLGVALNDDMGLSKLYKLATALMAFVIGYTACRWTYNSNKFINLFIVVGALYVFTCVIALLKLYPSLFPLIFSSGFRADGTLVVRPEITIDQNFQIFYLMFIPSIFILEFKLFRFAVTGVLSLLAIYVLISLQTRSGLLIFLGILGIVMVVAPVINKKYGRYKLILLPIICLLAVIVFYDKIIMISAPLIERFTSLEVKTVEGRMFSAFYLFQHIINPLYWIPQGNEEFVSRMGDVPHFNPTAMFLEGGILGLVGWVMVFLIPLIRLGMKFIRGKLDLLSSLILVAGVASMMAQLSLNAPLYDHVWLWGGAVIGCYYRSIRSRPTDEPVREEKVDLLSRRKPTLINKVD